MSGAYSTLLKQYAKRREQIRTLRAAGWTLERIGRRYGMSKQRVGQVLNRQAK